MGSEERAREEIGHGGKEVVEFNTYGRRSDQSRVPSCRRHSWLHTCTSLRPAPERGPAAVTHRF